jgi:hypothetical protein
MIMHLTQVSLWAFDGLSTAVTLRNAICCGHLSHPITHFMFEVVKNMNKCYFALLLIALSLIVPPSAAELVEISLCDDYEGQISVADPKMLTIPLFDPSLGKLVKVDINCTMNGSQWVGFTNTHPEFDQTVDIHSFFWLNVILPDRTQLKLENQNKTYNNYVEPYNSSVLLYSSPCGFNYTFCEEEFFEVSYDASNGEELWNFTAETSRENMDFLIEGESDAEFEPDENYNFATNVYYKIAMCVKYTYDNEVGDSEAGGSFK